MITHQDAMIQAIKEGKTFCSNYNTAPYGNSFSEFEAITIQKFFDTIYYTQNKELTQCQPTKNL